MHPYWYLHRGHRVMECERSELEILQIQDIHNFSIPLYLILYVHHKGAYTHIIQLIYLPFLFTNL